MVGKLTADELRGTWRDWRAALLPSLLVFLVSLVLIGLGFPFIMGMGFIGAILSLLVAVFSLPIILIVRYHRTLYGPRGYLTMTLPVRGREIYWSRFWTGLLVMLADIVLGFLLVTLLTAASDAGSRQALFSTAKAVWNAFLMMPNRGTTLLIIVSYLVFVIVLAIIQWGFILSKGNEARFHRLGIGGPVIMYVITYLLQQLASTIGILTVPLGVRFASADGQSADLKLVFESSWPSIRASLNGNPGESFTLGLGFLIALALLGVVYLVMTIRSIEHHTSLK